MIKDIYCIVGLSHCLKKRDFLGILVDSGYQEFDKISVSRTKFIFKKSTSHIDSFIFNDDLFHTFRHLCLIDLEVFYRKLVLIRLGVGL